MCDIGAGSPREPLDGCSLEGFASIYDDCPDEREIHVILTATRKTHTGSPFWSSVRTTAEVLRRR